MDQGGFFLDARQLGGFVEEIVFDDESCSHMHKYALLMHIVKVNLSRRVGRGSGTPEAAVYNS